MNLYLLTQSVNNDYDTYDSCIVSANSEEEAKLITPHGGKFEDKYAWNSSWGYSSNDINAEYIGTYFKDISGIVLSSFNAG